MMEEAVSERLGDVNTEDVSAEDKAREQTTAPEMSSAPRRGLRQRGAGRPRAGASAQPTDVNGASLSPQSTGRVLRDRSTRTVPAWLKDAKSEDENDEELDTDPAVIKRRKVSNGKRKKLSEGAAGAQDAGAGLADLPDTTVSQDQKSVTDVEALNSKRPATQIRAKPISNRTIRSPAQPVCKTEPRTESSAVEGKNKMKFEIKKKEEGDHVSEDMDKEPQFQDLTNISEGEDGAVSSDEDVPFMDDLNDQSYDPKGEK